MGACVRQLRCSVCCCSWGRRPARTMPPRKIPPPANLRLSFWVFCRAPAVTLTTTTSTLALCSTPSIRGFAASKWTCFSTAASCSWPTRRPSSIRRARCAVCTSIPLRQAVQAGSVGASEPLLLLIDVKTEAGATYPLVDAQLADYADMLTLFESGGEPLADRAGVEGGAACIAGYEIAGHRKAVPPSGSYAGGPLRMEPIRWVGIWRRPSSQRAASHSRMPAPIVESSADSSEGSRQGSCDRGPER